jgi:carbon storage regulator
MLILTRRIGEEIFIDKAQIKIKVIYARNGSVAIGINAPKSIDVDRKEIYLRKRLNEITPSTGEAAL